jgi:hypothetical protein
MRVSSNSHPSNIGTDNMEVIVYSKRPNFEFIFVYSLYLGGGGAIFRRNRVKTQ